MNSPLGGNQDEKILTKMLAVSLCAALLGGTAAALPAILSDSSITANVAETYGNFQYFAYKDDSITITEYTGNDAEVTIPSEINEKSVTSIANCAFSHKYSLTSINIPDSVTYIGSCAFGCDYDDNRDYVPIEGFIIYGKAGSEAERYAKRKGITFVDNTVAVTRIKLNKTAVTLEKGKTETLTATIQPTNATDKPLTWQTTDKTVATVRNGKITAVGAGTCTVFAKSVNGKKGSCTVTVTAPKPLVNGSVISSELVQTGDKVRISGSAAGGTGSYKYAYYYKRSSNTKWRTLGTEFGTNSSVTFTPTAEADFDVKVVVRDENDTTAEKLFTVKAMNKLALTNVSVLQRTNVRLGTSIPILGKAVGGDGGYTYAFYFKRSTNFKWNVLGTEFGTETTAKLKPTAAVSYDIRVIVKDKSGRTASKIITTTVK